MSIQSFFDYTEEQIKEQVRQLAKQELGIEHLRPQGVLTGLVETSARLTAWLYGTFIFPLKKQISLDSATGSFLEQWGTLLSVPRKQPSKARGNATVRYSRDVRIPAGATLSISGTTLEFVVQTSAAATGSGELPIAIEAIATGSAYNNIKNGTASFKTVISGVDALTLKDGWQSGGGSPGTDIEDDENYRKRIRATWLRIAAGDVPMLYEAEAQLEKGVEEAKVFRAAQGFGSARVVCRGPQNTIPADDVLTRVHLRLQNAGLVARQLIIQGVQQRPVSVLFSFAGSLSRQEAQNRVHAYFLRLPIGARYTIAGLYNLFDDQARIQFEAPLFDDTALPADAIYSPSITATRI